MATVLLIIGLLVLTAIVFSGWLIVRAVGFVFRTIVGTGTAQKPGGNNNSQATSVCQQANCRAENARHARFCRRCGNPVGAARMRYVA